MLRINLVQTKPGADGHAFAARIDQITKSTATTGFGPEGPCVVDYETGDLRGGVIGVTRAAKDHGFAVVRFENLV